MRIRDWSSGVCSSDLGPVSIGFHLALELGLDRQRQVEAPADPLVLAARKIDRAGINADQFTRAVSDESVGERRFDRRRRCGETPDFVLGAAVDIILSQIEIVTPPRLSVSARLSP